MIEFCGEISNEIKLYIQKTSTRGAFFVCLVVGVILFIPILIAAIMWHWACIIMIIPFIMTVIFASIPRINAPMKLLNQYFPARIIIDDGKIDIESKRLSLPRAIIDVKKVVDMGEWYMLFFYFPHKSIYFVCQKNLLINGTIEEFEKLFDGKLEIKSEK